MEREGPGRQPPSAFEEERAEAIEHAYLAWRSLGARLSTITPSAIARSVLVLGAVVVLGWLVTSAWTELYPFAVGLVLAYITLPIVDAFDRFMPRWIAALLVVALEIAGFFAILALFLPPIVEETVRLANSLPTGPELRELLSRANVAIETLPPAAREFLREGLTGAAGNVRDNVLVYAQRSVGFAVGAVFQLFSTLGFVIGLFAIPTFLAAVLTDHRLGVRALNRVLPVWFKPDFWAVIRILDRTFSTYLRGKVVVAIVVGALTVAGFAGIEYLLGVDIRYTLLLAVIAALFYFVPDIGPILGAIPGVVVAFATSPEAGLSTLVLYVLVQMFVGAFIAPSLENRSVDLPPALVVLAVVLLSPFGLPGVLLAAPLAVVARDLFRYAYGRLSDPPAPAGVLPSGIIVSPEGVPIRPQQPRRRRSSAAQYRADQRQIRSGG